MNGNARGAMGIDVARFRNDDALGIAIGNFANEMTALYVSYGDDMQFIDEAIPTGLGPATRLQLKFGLFFFDYDLDGRLDLLTANGHLEEDINRCSRASTTSSRRSCSGTAGPRHDTEFLPRRPRSNAAPTCSSRSSAAAPPTPTSTATATWTSW